MKLKLTEINNCSAYTKLMKNRRNKKEISKVDERKRKVKKQE